MVFYIPLSRFSIRGEGITEVCMNQIIKEGCVYVTMKVFTFRFSEVASGACTCTYLMIFQR